MERLEMSTFTPVYSGCQYLEELDVALSKLREKWNNDDCPLVLKESIFVADEVIDDSDNTLKNLNPSMNKLALLARHRLKEQQMMEKKIAEEELNARLPKVFSVHNFYGFRKLKIFLTHRLRVYIFNVNYVNYMVLAAQNYAY